MSRDLSTLLRLSPLAGDPIPFPQFLAELHQYPERTDPAHALVLRSIEAMGIEDPEEEPDPERKQFLKHLRDNHGIVSLKAFHHVVGSQRFSSRVTSWLGAARNGGAQLRQMLIIEGGPGAGKDYFKDGIFNAVEKYGEIYAVKGCPEHENPFNLLKLLEPNQLEALAEATGLGSKLWDKKEGKPGDLLKVAGDPCQHCYKTLKGDIANPNANPSLEQVAVEKIRLSKRVLGISEWKPGSDISLVQALRQAQRGIMGMPDGFIERKPEPGKTDERLLLLDAVPERRLPGVPTESDQVASASPMDELVLVTTNEKALKAFLETLPDKDAFTGRSKLFKQGYNLFRVEEKRAYRDVYNALHRKAHFDPLVIDLIATLAVVSRYAVPVEGKPFAHPIDKLRLYQGEPLTVKARPGSEWETYWSTKVSSYSSGGYSSGGYGGGGFGSYGSSGSSSGSKPTDSKDGEKVELPTDVELSTQMLWAVSGADEGLVGLDMRFMIDLVSSINEYGLKTPHACVNSLEVIELLRQAINNKMGNSNLTESQEQVLKRCQKWLGGKPGARLGGDKPELIEAEYRRMLKQVILRVLEPDYVSRAQELYEDYKLHAQAAFLENGQAVSKGVKHPKHGIISIDHSLVDDLDRYRLGKIRKDTAGKLVRDPLTDEEKKFRGSINGIISDSRDEFVEDQGGDAEKRKLSYRNFRDNWETIPELANAIRAKLDHELATRAERLLTTEVISELTDQEQKQLVRAKQDLRNLGFCDSCSKPVLDYARRVRVWAYKA